MSWSGWPTPGTALPGVVSAPPIQSAVLPGIAPTQMIAPAASTALHYNQDQWAQMQQQNWQQWAQWQQQYQQWHQQYGAEYNKSMNAMTTNPPPPLMDTNTSVPPPPPNEAKPPPPPPPEDSVQRPQQPSGYMTVPPPAQQYTTAPPTHAQTKPQWSNTNKRTYSQTQGSEQPETAKRPLLDNPAQWNKPVPAPVQPPVQTHAQKVAVNLEELTEAEKKFDKEFAAWEAQFNKWKDQNANHPDQTQFMEYEKKWESWRNSLLDRREQMRKKRLALQASVSPKPTSTAIPQVFNEPPPTNLMSKPPPSIPLAPDVFSKPPPTQNNEPLAFKANKGDSLIIEGETKSSFLQPSSPSAEGGIPGLDLVKEDIPDEKPPSPKKPDFDAISKGINTILGDPKLMNMLSMVSQKKPSSEEQLQPNKAETVNNFDDQTQMSFASDQEGSRFSGGYEKFGGQNDRFNQPRNFENDRFRGNERNFEPHPPPNLGNDNRFRGNANSFDGNPNQGFRGNFNPNDRFRGNGINQNNFNEPPPSNFRSNEPPNRLSNFGDDRRSQNFGRNNSFDNNQKFSRDFEGNRGGFNQRGRGYNYDEQYDEYNEGNYYGAEPREDENWNEDDEYDKYHNMFEEDDNNRGYDDNNQGYADNNQGYDDNNQGYNDNNQGYDDNNQGYDNPEPVKPVQEEPPPVVEEEPLFVPQLVVDYEHKPLKEPEPEVILEPIRKFDYRHKNVNRIPYPQRPTWLYGSLRNIRQFDPLGNNRFPGSFERDFNYPPKNPVDIRERDTRIDTLERPIGGNRPGREEPERSFSGNRPNRDEPERSFSGNRPNRDEPERSFSGNRPNRDEPERSFSGNRPNRDEPERSFSGNRPNRDDFNRRYSDSSRNSTPWNSKEKKPISDNNRALRFEPPSSKPLDLEELSDDEWNDETNKNQDWNDKRSKNPPSRPFSSSPEKKIVEPQAVAPRNTTLEELINIPGRFNRPSKIVIILRGPPGSGKTYLAKLIKDREVENGGSAPRILSLDDYFMVEHEKDVMQDGKIVKIKEMVYEYEAEMEETYRMSLIKSFKKTITDGYFNFIVVDNVNQKVKNFGEMWSFAKQSGFQVYICELDLDPQLCFRRNIHNRNEKDIEDCIAGWEPTPQHHPSIDPTTFLESFSAITEVEMEEVEQEDNGREEEVEDHIRSKWDTFDCSINNLARLDGVSKPIRSSKSMEEYLQLDDEWTEPTKPLKPGQKRVRWADLEEQKQQKKMKALGFVVGHTDWNRMMDPTNGESALIQTKYIERVRKY
ncbi:YLP motif-containing protein 1-like isoform X2 [Sitophilus oryzae]|uniref:YLP motif-containing protein 1 n=1 Tax=Sitophilus oryzae TaxID=7048 RepID=A0A6J2X8Q8_SITOR|nr:YLP motif-containing protein 1-like isoform X2 [Sitophilus oryzae]